MIIIGLDSESDDTVTAGASVMVALPVCSHRDWPSRRRPDSDSDSESEH